ncbi:MAG: nitroreductase family protein [Candidatus Helarchaeota archaeon]
MEPADILMKIIKERRSIRKFTDEDVPEEMIQKFLIAAKWAPSAGDVQAWEFIVIRDGKVKEQLYNVALRQSPIIKAPVVIVVCANQNRSARTYRARGANLYCYQDSAAAIQNLLLTVHANGYGAVWIGAFDDIRAGTILKTPEGIRPVALIPIGRPAESPSPTPRYKLKKITHLNQFGEKYLIEG